MYRISISIDLSMRGTREPSIVENAKVKRSNVLKVFLRRRFAERFLDHCPWSVQTVAREVFQCIGRKPGTGAEVRRDEFVIGIEDRRHVDFYSPI